MNRKMTLFRRINKNDLKELITGIRNEPYLLINTIFAGVILLIMIYSGIFSPEKDNYPVVCLHEKLTGQPCISCGLSHSFSLIVRGRLAEAAEWNPYGLRVFLFFAFQLAMRVLFSAFWVKSPDTRKELILYDSLVSGVVFIICFWPYLAAIFNGVLRLIRGS